MQLATDDSFQFNRVVGIIKQHVAMLPEASADDDAIMAALQVGWSKLVATCIRPPAAAVMHTVNGVPVAAMQARLHSNSRAGKSQQAEPSSAATTGGSEQQAPAAGVAQGRGAAAASQEGAAAAEDGAQAPQPHSHQGRGGVPAEVDPFGIDQVLEQQRAHEVQQAAAAAWTPEVSSSCEVASRMGLVHVLMGLEVAAQHDVDKYVFWRIIEA